MGGGACRSPCETRRLTHPAREAKALDVADRGLLLPRSLPRLCDVPSSVLVAGRGMLGRAPCPSPEVIHALVLERDPAAPVVGEDDAALSFVVLQSPSLHDPGADTDHGHGVP